VSEAESDRNAITQGRHELSTSSEKYKKGFGEREASSRLFWTVGFVVIYDWI